MDNTRLKNRMSSKVAGLRSDGERAEVVAQLPQPASNGYLALDNDAVDLIRTNLKSQQLTLDLFDVVKSPSGGSHDKRMNGVDRQTAFNIAFFGNPGSTMRD